MQIRGKVAVLGCCHGQLDAVYDQLTVLEQQQKQRTSHTDQQHAMEQHVACLLVCGDFQAIRNKRDLLCMAVPAKYRALGGFYRYYTGEKKAPILTIVIGGNHEASNYMWELYHGGWLAPNIYYLGAAGCVQVNGVRIAGLSGIYNAQHYNLGHYEKIPYDQNSLRSIYHLREYDVMKLMQLSLPDIFLSHDWPQGIEKHGDLQGLLRRKPFFRTDISNGTLGSPPAMRLLRALRPSHWFSAHLHCKFEAIVMHVNDSKHHGAVQGDKGFAVEPGAQRAVEETQERDMKGGDNPGEIEISLSDGFDVEPLKDGWQASGSNFPSSFASDNLKQSKTSTTSATVVADANPEEIVLNDEIEAVELPPVPQSKQAQSVTRFLALDKCLPRRQYLEIIEIPGAQPLSRALPSSTPRFTFDPEWLAITRALHPYLTTTRAQRRLPDSECLASLIQQEIAWVREHIRGPHSDGLLDVSACQEFWPTAPGPSPENEGPEQYKQPPYYTNPQTEALCSLLEIENKINPPPQGMHRRFENDAALV